MTISKRKVGIVWATPNSTNLGVSALAYSSLILFQEIAKRKNIIFEYILWGAPEGISELNIGTESIRIEGIKPFYGGDLFRYVKNLIRRPWVFLNYSSIRKLKKCDIIVDTGEGDSYSDIYGMERFRNFDFIKQKFYKSKNLYILLPQTIGPFNSKEALRKGQKSLNLASAVIARDTQSFDFCKNLYDGHNLFLSIDMAFFLPYQKLNLPKNDKVRIGINVSGLLWEGGYTGANQFGLSVNYQELIISILDYLSTMDNIEVHLIGHVVGRDEDIDDDGHVLKELYTSYNNFILAPTFKSPIEAKNYIASMDFFSGARMHSCIAAISAGIPVLPMAYSRKFNGLFSDTLAYNRILDMKSLSNKDALNLFKNTLESKDKIKSEISEIQQGLITAYKENMICQISNLIP